MVNCCFCGLQNLKSDRRRINLESKLSEVLNGNLHYVLEESTGERKPVCNDCYEDVRYGAHKGFKVI